MVLIVFYGDNVSWPFAGRWATHMESRGAAAQVTCSSSRTKTCDLGGGLVPQANAVIVFCRASCGASMPRDIVSVSYVLEETGRVSLRFYLCALH